MNSALRTVLAMLLCAAALAAGSPGAAHAQTAAEVDSRLDTLFGSHAPYRAFLAQLQQSVGADDRQAVAALVDYPLRVRLGGKTVQLRDEKQFLAAYERLFTQQVKDAIAAQTYPALFANAQGLMIGNGEVWFAGVGKAGTVRIIAINH